ncbi:hypothetical protein L873DRAFT_684123 [Choiromyces venosus 120613-1]|uniref:Uncharacterized protein n=1 Tax=Choiromyces venosus 120613-1 TaxID=1336337 RepID=A0A3N4IY77_9PEZI|nr:hypothetical protein L873DRAFT_684123 [Choiromyces venosus 120613-1]
MGRVDYVAAQRGGTLNEAWLGLASMEAHVRHYSAKIPQDLVLFFFSLQATTPNNTTTSGDLIHSRGVCYREIEMSIAPPVGTGDAQVSSPSEASSPSKALSSSSSWLNSSPTCTAILCSRQLPRSEVLAKSSICLSNFFTFCSASEICCTRRPSSCNNTAPVFRCFGSLPSSSNHSASFRLRVHSANLFFHALTRFVAFEYLCFAVSHSSLVLDSKNFAISSQSIHAFPQVGIRVRFVYFLFCISANCFFRFSI